MKINPNKENMSFIFINCNPYQPIMPNIIGKNYQDKSGVNYLPLCIQPIIVLKASRGKLNTFLARAKKASSALGEANCQSYFEVII